MTRNPLLSSWRGDAPLGSVFWGWGVALSTIVTLAFVLLTRTGGPGFVAGQLLLLAFVPYTAWILISIWRCAENAQVEWHGIVARWLTVAWAINALMLIVFIEIDLAFG